jgi:hypothetical protein
VDRAASAVDLVVDLVTASAITDRAELADWVAMRLPSAAVRVVPVVGLAAEVVDAVVEAAGAAVVGVVLAVVVDAEAVAADAAVRLWPTAEDSSAIASTAGVGSSFV